MGCFSRCRVAIYDTFYLWLRWHVSPQVYIAKEKLVVQNAQSSSTHTFLKKSIDPKYHPRGTKKLQNLCTSIYRVRCKNQPNIFWLLYPDRQQDKKSKKMGRTFICASLIFQINPYLQTTYIEFNISHIYHVVYIFYFL